MLTGEAYTKNGIRIIFYFFAEYDKVSLQNYGGGKEQGGVIGL